MSSRILTIPNALAILRIILLPVFVYITFKSAFVGAIFISVLAFTDWLDGWIARKFNQDSELGRILDPISDRALTLTSFVTFIFVGALPLWFALLIGIRELLVAIGTIIIFTKKHVRLDVNYVGKVSAFAAMAGTPCWVMAHETHGAAKVYWALAAWIFTVIAVPTGYYSLIAYMRAYRRA